MRIGIILHPYGEDKPAGLARTIFELAQALVRYGREHEFVIFLKNKPRVMPQFPGANWNIEALGSGILWLERLKRSTPCDVYVFNTPVIPVFFRPRRSVVLALDFAYKYFPAKTVAGRMRNKAVERYHRFSLRRADAIIAMSDATKRDIVNFFNIEEGKITVGYWGFKPVCSVPPETVAVQKPFFLFVGVVKERKNVLNIVKGFYEFTKKYPDHTFVIAGNARGEYGDEIKAYIAKEGMSKRIVFPGYLTEGQISYLYQNAQALVFPSLVEGFGFPVMEAMDCGTPVITSNISSLAELGADDSAILVNPYNPSDIARAMREVAGNEGQRRALAEAGLRRSKMFRWENRIGVFLDVIAKK